MPSALVPPVRVVQKPAQAELQPPDATIDITAQRCPMTFVHTRLALDRLASGQRLAVRLEGEEPRTNIPASARELGHRVEAVIDSPDGTTLLLIQKK